MSDLIFELVQAFCCLPGVGPKSAQRMTLHLLGRDREGGQRLAKVLAKTMEEVGHCKKCRTFSEDLYCRLCAQGRRNEQLICIVETPADVMAIEQSGSFGGGFEPSRDFR